MLQQFWAAAAFVLISAATGAPWASAVAAEPAAPSSSVAPSKSSATPAPCFSPLPADSPEPDVYVYLKDRTAACFATPPGATGFEPGRGPSGSEVAAIAGVPDANGIPVVVYFPTAPATFAPSASCASPSERSVTLKSGVSFVDCEPRVVIEFIADEPVASPSPAASPEARVESNLVRKLIVEVNASGACYVHGSTVADDQVANCTVSPPPPSSNNVPAPAPTTTWTAMVKVPLGIVNPALDPTNGLRPFRFCASMLAVEPPEASPELACRTYSVRFVSDPWKDHEINYGTSANGQGQNASSTASSTSAYRRRLAGATAVASPAASAKPQPMSLVGTGVFPLNPHARISVEVQDSDALTSIANTSTAASIKSLGQVSPALSGSSGLAFNGTQSGSNDFGAIDADITQRLIPTAFRGFNESVISKTDARAFASTNVLDLQPFDPSQILALTYGVTATELSNDNSTLGLTYFRDGTQNESGGVLHGDTTFFWSPVNLSVGYSHTIANDLYASTSPSNKYLTVPDPVTPAFPTSSDAPLTHSTNDVFGLGLGFGASGPGEGNEPSVTREFSLFNRYATNGVGHDLTEALSYQNDAAGARVSENGSTLVNSALAGYRDISYTYDPLLMPYDPFAGNRIYFTRLASKFSQPRCDKTVTTPCPYGDLTTSDWQVALSLVRADDGSQATYAATGLTFTAPINPTFSIDAVYMRSNIAGSVEGRLAGKSVVIGASATNLLENNASSLSLSAKADKLLSISAGLAFADKPACTGATSCSSSFSRSFTSNGTLTFHQFALNESIAPGAIQGGTGASNLIASNRIVANGLSTYHYCTKGSKSYGFAPSITYTNAIPGTGSSFTPGSVVQEAIYVGPSTGTGIGFEISHSDVSVAPGVTFTLPTHSWSFALTSANELIWHKIGNTGGDACK